MTVTRTVLDTRLPSDAGATFDREVSLAAAGIAPMVTWGTSPEDAAPITERVPDPSAFADADRREAARRALDYMGLTPGTPLAEVPVDRLRTMIYAYPTFHRGIQDALSALP